MPCDHYIVHYILICSLISFFLGVLISNNCKDKNNSLPFFSMSGAKSCEDEKDATCIIKQQQQDDSMPVWECSMNAPPINFLQRDCHLSNTVSKTMLQRNQLKTNLIF